MWAVRFSRPSVHTCKPFPFGRVLFNSLERPTERGFDGILRRVPAPLSYQRILNTPSWRRSRENWRILSSQDRIGLCRAASFRPTLSWSLSCHLTCLRQSALARSQRMPMCWQPQKCAQAVSRVPCISAFWPWVCEHDSKYDPE